MDFKKIDYEGFIITTKGYRAPMVEFPSRLPGMLHIKHHKIIELAIEGYTPKEMKNNLSIDLSTIYRNLGILQDQNYLVKDGYGYHKTPTLELYENILDLMHGY